MAEKKKGQDERDVSAGELAGILRGYGLNPHLFDDLIHQAVQNQWTPEQFIAELYASDEFAAAFPGIFNEDGSLKMSPAEYLQLAYGPGGYLDIARNYGINLNLEKIGRLVEGNVSPDEWARRALILQQARQSEAYREEFNKILRARGHEPLEKGDWFRFIAGRSQSQIENLYEAVSLRMSDLDISREEALRAARQIGKEAPGQPQDLQRIVAEVRRVRDEVGPELRAAGITDADLAVLASGADPKGIAPRLEQIVRNRRALIGAPSGGRTTFAPEPEER